MKGSLTNRRLFPQNRRNFNCSNAGDLRNTGVTRRRRTRPYNTSSLPQLLQSWCSLYSLIGWILISVNLNNRQFHRESDTSPIKDARVCTCVTQAKLAHAFIFSQTNGAPGWVLFVAQSQPLISTRPKFMEDSDPPPPISEL